ncbi:hypothetical protein C3V37_04540 [Peptostreptococcaceae bacterium oral taxon 929]|nr:hypothetical protein C3V37_04540 [Peptostreptococcaceae bacterium oral taxon 929]
MEGRRRPRKSLLMYDKVLFFSALLLFAFTLIFALDWIISGVAMNNADGFDVLDKVAGFGKRTGIYFIFIVITFVTTTLAFIYTMLLRRGMRKNAKTLDNVMIGFGLLFTFIDFFAMSKMRKILKVFADPLKSWSDIARMGLGDTDIENYKPIFGVIIGILALITLCIGCILLYRKIFLRVRPKDVSRQINAVGRGVSNAANAVKETAQNAAEDLRNPDNVEDYNTRRPAPKEYIDDDYDDYNKYNDNNQYNDYNERPQRPVRPQRPDAPRRPRPDAPQRPARPARPDAPQRPARPDAPRRPRPQNENLDEGNGYDE